MEIEHFRGDLLLSGDPRWEEARQINNERVQGRPAIIARCAGVADVRAAIRLARERDLAISVRSGGHGVAGWSSGDDVLVIDLTPLRWVRVDAAQSSAWIGGGTLALDLILEANEFGLAPVTGVTPTVGISGLVLGLGEGYLTPKHGFGADSVLALELVTADGRVLQVSADQHPDLFWAMRGAGANFGVVTALQLRLHPEPASTVGGWIAFDHRDTPAVARQVWKIMEHGSEHIFPFAVFDLDESGNVQVRVFPGHTGPAELAEREVDELRRSGRVTSDDTRTMSYVELIHSLGGPQEEGPDRPARMFWDALRFPFDGAAERQIEVLLTEAKRLVPTSHFTLWRTARSAPPSTPSAAPRAPGVTLFLPSYWHAAEDDAEQLRRLRETAAALRGSGALTYAANAMNHVSEYDAAGARQLYGAEAYDRIAALKATLDPTNVFSRNYNIPPAAEQ